MSECQDAVRDELRTTLNRLGYPSDDLRIEDTPEDTDIALASAAAFEIAGDAGQSPEQVATEIASEFDVNACDHFDGVASAGPYVTFFDSTGGDGDE
jgi:arginyl-tRNA synthetase